MTITDISSEILAVSFVIMFTASIDLHAHLRVYDGFGDNSPGDDIDTPLNGGFGFEDSWIRAQEGANDTVTVTNGTWGGGNVGGLFDNLAVVTSPASTNNYYIRALDTDDRFTANRKLSDSAGVLAGRDDILWASVLWSQNGNNFGRHVGFSLGTDGLANRSVNVSTLSAWGGSGDGNAFGIGGAINSQDITPAVWTNGVVDTRVTAGAKSLSSSFDYIVILKYVFADGSTNDTLYAWGFSENETIDEATFNANAISLSTIIDQDTFNILSISQSRVGIEIIDEIRLGDRFDDVTTGTQPPPPAGTVIILQ